jgi:tetratricopeptide (TPR) repeat protein
MKFQTGDALLSVTAKQIKGMFLLGWRATGFRLRSVTWANRFLLSCIFVLSITSSFAAEDASIDRLLSKLPPPEKIIKPSAPQAQQRTDPVLQDELFIGGFVAANMGNSSQARFYFRKLAEKYPQSETALIFWGEFAYRLRYYDEATAAFQKALALAPNGLRMDGVGQSRELDRAHWCRIKCHGQGC